MEYTLSELMIVASAREIQDGEVIFAGVGNPLLGALLAQKSHAPNAMIATEGAGRTVISIPLQRRRFLERVDYITSPGYLTGGDSRERSGLPRGGPAAVITDKCIFRFHPETRELMLDSIHPNVTVEDVKKEIPWDLLVSDNLKETKVPTEEELRIIHALDPQKIFIGNGLKELTFESYITMLKSSLDHAI